MMEKELFCIPAALVILVMVYLSIPKGQSRAQRNEIVKQSKETNLAITENQRISMRVAEANERAHRRNHADKVRLTRELEAMNQSPINYSDPIPRLTAGGDVIDVDLEDVPPQLTSGRRTLSDTLAMIRHERGR